MNKTSCLVAVSILGVAPGVARADDWATAGLDGGHTRLSAEVSGAAFGDGRWSASFAGGRILTSPVVADGIAVTADLGGAVHAVAADSGQPLWQAQAGSDVQGAVAAARGRLFVPAAANKLIALRLSDGAPLWTKDVGGMVLSSPAPLDGDVVIAAGLPQRHILRLSGTTGAIVWQSPDVMAEFSNTSPAVGAGLVVVGSNGGRIYAFDAATGQPRWSYAGDGVVNLAAPLLADGRVYLAGGGDSSRVHGIDAATGTPLPGWPIALPAPDPDVAGTPLGRQRAVSSPISAGGLVLLQTRLDDMIDTNGDGASDEVLSREWVVALDPLSSSVVWQHLVARAEIKDLNQVPKFFVCPTPAAYGTGAGAPMAAVASSLSANVSILDVASGSELARQAVAGPALASPVVANGRLITASMGGVCEAMLSSVNHPPAAPIPAGNPAPADAGVVTLRWLPAPDPDAELPSYEVRIDTDGEVLQSWQQQVFAAAGVTSAAISGLSPGVTYTFAVRARDSHGAASPWSDLQPFQVTVPPASAVNGQPADSLAAALSSAMPGDVVTLGAGVYTLTQTLHVGAGVSIQGAGAGRTTLDGSGLAVGVTFDGASAGHTAGLDGVTVSGADSCVQVGPGGAGVRLAHVIVRDCRIDGIAVAAGGSAAVANATIVGNGTGVHATGTTAVKNSLLTGNQVGQMADHAGALTSSYNDLFANAAARQNVTAGPGDLATAVAFADLTARDLRLTSAQPSTDQGDPADDFAAEPMPNGGRINLGAFGGTADAETSPPAAGAPAAAPVDPVHDRALPPDAGCNVTGRPAASWLSLLAIAGLLQARLRRRPAKRRR
jgi:outer membrane protein assembly factor BamB/chitodextrinase